MKRTKKIFSLLIAVTLFAVPFTSFVGCAKKEEKIKLKVANWEEYIDLGDWEEDEELTALKELSIWENPSELGKNSLITDFEEWFNSTHNFKVEVEYSTFGTNEDLYNRLNLGDEYDLVCPSDYMIMKLIADGNYVEYSDSFWDIENEENYYAKYVSRYIDSDKDGEGVFNRYDWHNKIAGYMWGTCGFVYNPDPQDGVTSKDVSTWKLFLNENFKKKLTIKDNVRDSYFAALGALNSDKLLKGEFGNEELSAILNDTSDETIAKAEDILKKIKENVYSFETDSGKADMVTGKIVANFQWSGDAIYTMDEAQKDEIELWYSTPDECTNLWFDGWLKLKNGGDSYWKGNREIAAEAFVNYLSKPESAVRNMYQIGYSSVMAGDGVFEYMDYNYGATEDTIDTVSYDLSYFFGEGDYCITADKATFEFDGEGNINKGRQLFAQYPPQNVIDRSVIMLDFGDRLTDINQMWINVRCLDLKDISPTTYGGVAGVIALTTLSICLYVFRYKIFIRDPKPIENNSENGKTE